jgi:hypothetical protein
MIDVIEQVIERHPKVKNEGIPEVTTGVSILPAARSVWFSFCLSFENPAAFFDQSRKGGRAMDLTWINQMP